MHDLWSPPTHLELHLSTRQTVYPLDLGGKTPEEFRREVLELDRQLREGFELPRRPFPLPPAVRLELEVLNIGDDSAEVWLGGDDSFWTLRLDGPGALSVTTAGLLTADIRYSYPVRLAPGDRYTLHLQRLSYGFRGLSRWYWTEPGEYTLTAEYQLGAPADSPEDLDRQPPPGPKLCSEPICLLVEG